VENLDIGLVLIASRADPGFESRSRCRSTSRETHVPRAATWRLAPRAAFLSTLRVNFDIYAS
jgi:hypothetical protein